jgi:hypothetical protein
MKGNFCWNMRYGTRDEVVYATPVQNALRTYFGEEKYFNLESEKGRSLMQLTDIFPISSSDTPFFLILSVVSISIGLVLIIFGLVKQKNQKKSTLGTCCIVLGFLIIITHTIQIIVGTI